MMDPAERVYNQAFPNENPQGATCGFSFGLPARRNVAESGKSTLFDGFEKKSKKFCEDFVKIPPSVFQQLENIRGGGGRKGLFARVFGDAHAAKAPIYVINSPKNTKLTIQIMCGRVMT
jgi:hypothetical protein